MKWNLTPSHNPPTFTLLLFGCSNSDHLRFCFFLLHFYRLKQFLCVLYIYCTKWDYIQEVLSDSSHVWSHERVYGLCWNSCRSLSEFWEGCSLVLGASLERIFCAGKECFLKFFSSGYNNKLFKRKVYIQRRHLCRSIIIIIITCLLTYSMD